ncbi:MAG: hypothetical protein C0467_24875 [Planctomycetaceae bacterium]|nr:hypothetical protein [Planctomycetaceae bacterium]
MIISTLLVVFSALHWQVFLRALAIRLGNQELVRRLHGFSWWIWIGTICLLYRSAIPDREQPVIGIFCAAVLLFSVASYARLASAIATTVAKDAPIE